MYNVAFTGIVMVTIVKFVALDQVTIVVLRAVGVLWGSFFCSFAFVLPRWLEVRKQKAREDTTMQGKNKSSYLPTRVRTYFNRTSLNEIKTDTNHSSRIVKPKSILKSSDMIDSRKSKDESSTDPSSKATRQFEGKNMTDLKRFTIDIEKTMSLKNTDLVGYMRDVEKKTSMKALAWETEIEGPTATVPNV
jgi:hypothetical protein